MPRCKTCGHQAADHTFPPLHLAELGFPRARKHRVCVACKCQKYIPNKEYPPQVQDLDRAKKLIKKITRDDSHHKAVNRLIGKLRYKAKQ
jgi:hypothetical protein